ncbi:unnamed protein product [Amoebophrya sp. A120]|nr:unnamed protein product [Amoebophrya sp. A120]|eukprot:GSA120T00024558001.1
MNPSSPVSLQRLLGEAVGCYGCGTKNPHGFQLHSYIKRLSHDKSPAKKTAVAVESLWYPKEYHCGPPGFLYGGLSASLLDCLANWAAAVHRGVEELGAPGGIPESASAGLSWIADADHRSNRHDGDLPSFLTDPEFHLSTVRALQEKSRHLPLPVTGSLQLKYLKPVPIRVIADTSTTAGAHSDGAPPAPGETTEGGGGVTAPTTNGVYLHAHVEKAEGRKYFVSGGIFVEKPEQPIVVLDNADRSYKDAAVTCTAVLIFPKQKLADTTTPSTGKQEVVEPQMRNSAEIPSRL